MKLAVVAFPGSTYQDTVYALETFNELEGTALDIDVVNEKADDLGDFDAVILPSGASYGDYLRPGAIGATTPVIDAITTFADAGGTVVGFGNGFQILTEAGLLPGALLQNADCQFTCATPAVTVVTAATPLTGALEPGQTVHLPIAHGFGNYWCDAETLKDLEERDQIVLKYEGEGEGEGEREGASQSDNQPADPSTIAAICNLSGNVLGMMPLPERATDPALSNGDGRAFWRSLIDSYLDTNESVEA